MGGNAFDDTRRLSEEAYADLCAKIAQALEALGQANDATKTVLDWRFPPEIADKAMIVKGNYTDYVTQVEE